MNQKTKRIIIAIVALVVVIGAATLGMQYFGVNKGDKEIQIKIVANGKTVYNETVDTDAEKLSQLLNEMKEDNDIKYESQKSTYGTYIVGLGKDKLIKEDKSANKFWVFSSDNNKQCKEAGFCDAADALNIADGDSFVFTLEAF